MEPILNPAAQINCKCEQLPLDHRDFVSTYLGQDKTKGRFADVTIEQCLTCKRNWLHYLVEFESFSSSGRWYRGILVDSDIKITPENAVSYLESLNWYIYGGSYFSSSGRIGDGDMYIDGY